MSSFTSTPNFDNLLLQTLMGRLQVQEPPNNHYLPKSLEELIYEAQNMSDEEDMDETISQLAKAEAKLEREIIKVIYTGKTECLKPNSGKTVTVADHQICVGYHEETGSEYRVWEWHGHIMVFDELHGYSPEYIYGNYFERLPYKIRGRIEVQVLRELEEKEREERVQKCLHLGLRSLIEDFEDCETNGGRILHRNWNAVSPRF